MIRTGKKFSKPEMSRVINGDTVLPEAEAAPEKVRLDILMKEIIWIFYIMLQVLLLIMKI